MIDTPGALADLVARARRKKRVALDTEFVWERTYYPGLGVIQLGIDQEHCFLIDAVALEDLSPLGELLADEQVEKILHDAPQDLTILRRATGAFPRNVFDTRCAAALAGLSSTTSLSGLLSELLGVELAKTESRTDWLRRPLSPQQIAYAVEDVCYLPGARDELVRRVRERQREEWLREEMAAYDDPALYLERDPREQYLRVKGSGRATPREKAILRELAAWREEEARRRDRPRGRIVGDETLLALARRKPRTPRDLGGLKGLSRRYTAPVLEQVQHGLKVERDDLPRSPRRRSISEEEILEARLEKAMRHMRHKSGEHHIDPPFVASRAEVRSLMGAGDQADPRHHRLLRGWRRDLVGEDLLHIAADGQAGA